MPPVVRQCRFCSCNFAKAEHLARHERSHTKERPYSCRFCAKSFSRHDTLLRHLRIHPNSPILQTSVSTNANLGVLQENKQPQATNPLDSSALNSRVASSSQPGQSVVGSLNASSPGQDVLHTPQPQRGILHTPIPSEQVDNISWSTSALGQPSMFGHSSKNQDVDPHFGRHDPDAGLFNSANDFLYPSWFVGEDFDFEAFNSSVMDPSSFTAWPAPSPLKTSRRASPRPPAPRTSRSGLRKRCTTNIHKLWFTRAHRSPANSRALSPVPADARNPTPALSDDNGVDERYRHDLSSRLKPRWIDDPLPSANFLNLCVQLYFTRFSPIFPILHAPTFRPSSQNSLLLLSMCSIGSLFVGTPTATAQGTKLFERLNKVVLNSWDSVFTEGSPESIAMIQASLIGQTFGLLSGNPKHLATVEAFHGTVISWVRKCGMLGPQPSETSLNLVPGDKLEDVWKTWAKGEERKRTALGLYIHDAQLAAMFHHDPTLRHQTIRLPSAADTNLFAASNVQDWAALYSTSSAQVTDLRECLHNSQPSHSPYEPLQPELNCKKSRFTSYVILSGISAAVTESRQTGQISRVDHERFRTALICWYQAHEVDRQDDPTDQLCLMVLWHDIFMSLLVDFDALERAIGRDEQDSVASASQYVGLWASSTEAKRCVIHASLIHRALGNMRFGSEPAIHVARAVFCAAIAWYCYLKFGDGTSPSLTSDTDFDFPEIKLLNINPFQHLFEASGFTMGKPAALEASPLCALTDFLHRIGHWDIARRFAEILGALVGGETDE